MNFEKLGTGEDQTATGDVEAAIEFVVQKSVEELPFKTCLRNAMVCPECKRMELIAQGTTPEDNTKLRVMCNNCGMFGEVTLV